MDKQNSLEQAKECETHVLNTHDSSAHQQSKKQKD